MSISGLTPPIYCVKCKAEIPADAVFCPKCGHDQRERVLPPKPELAQKLTNETILPSSQAEPAQPPPPQFVQVTNVRQGSNAGWWVALAVLLFATPVGCLTYPVLLAVIAAAMWAGFLYAPILLGAAVAGGIWKADTIPQPRRNAFAIGAFALGVLINMLWLGFWGAAQ